MRLLVVAASHGEKNLPFLKRIIETYQSMAMEVDIQVVSDTPKELGGRVKVIVGVPAKNPWSLPFAHKAVLAENVERYDLFAYTEDDMGVSEGQIRAFLRAAAAMESDEIPGFLRYEIAPDGSRLLTDVHGAFHWKPGSVRRRRGYTIAEFTNEHAGFYLLTAGQLRRCIASGGFLKAPYEGCYPLPETAATDPYTCCGFRKVICISALEDFLIRHMSDLYVTRHGIKLSAFCNQIQTLFNIRDGRHPVSTLGPTEPKVLQRAFYKGYYEEPSVELLAMVPESAKTILSVGCGCGASEAQLKRRGAEVLALPLDSVIGAAAARHGINVIYGTLDECLKNLSGRRFDCVLITNLLHLQPNSGHVVERCSRVVREGGTLVISGPNFTRMSIVIKRYFGGGEFQKLKSFDGSGISVCGPWTLARRLRKAGFLMTAVQWTDHPILGKRLGGVRLRVSGLTARNWILSARRNESRE